MAEITDEKSARAWLETQPHQAQVWFAARCALRAVPGLGTAPEETFDDLTFISFRAILSSSIGSTYLPPDIKDLSTIADFSTTTSFHGNPRFVGHKHNYSAYSAFNAAIVSAQSIYQPSAHSATKVSARSSRALAFAVTSEDARNLALSAAYTAASDDAEHPGDWPALWPGQTLPEGFDHLWPEMRQRLAGAPEKWAFWLEWYEAIQKGQPMPWDLSFAIATGLSEADWEAGPEHVQGRIAEIRARYELQQRIAELEASLEAAGDARHGIGGNNPPEALETEGAEPDPFLVIWEPLEDLKGEVGKNKPDKPTVRRAAETLKKISKAAWAWFLGKADAAASEFAKQIGKNGWKVLCAYLTALDPKVQAVLDAALKWLQALGG